MKIWIDLANSPHVLFFRPIIKALEEQGHQVLITARDFAQTIDLCERFRISYHIVGHHGGKNIINKGVNLFFRAYKLWHYGKQNMPIDVAVSHNSYSHCLASKALRIPTVTLMDYEHQPANHINFRLADKVIVPEVFPNRQLIKYGAKANRIIKFLGIKEEIYLMDAEPVEAEQREIAQWLGDRVGGQENEKKINVLLRTPATMAAYHRFENPIFNQLIDYLTTNPNVNAVVIPRTQEQAEELNRLKQPNLTLLTKVFDGIQMLFFFDLIISGGGTMNREAAVLGTPAYSVFAGKSCAVDRYLDSKGKLTFITKVEDFNRIKIVKKKGTWQNKPNRELFQQILSEIAACGNNQ